jgi:hypothetical protein
MTAGGGWGATGGGCSAAGGGCGAAGGGTKGGGTKGGGTKGTSGANGLPSVHATTALAVATTSDRTSAASSTGNVCPACSGRHV